MDLGRYTLGLQVKERLRRSGRVGKFALWTEMEIGLVRRLYPDYGKLVEALRGRSRKAIEIKAARLGVVQQRRGWTGAELVKLRRMYPVLSQRELVAEFSGRTWPAIIQRAHRSGLQKNKRPYTTTGDATLDAIRARCFALKYTMSDLDEIAGTRGYFRGRDWYRGPKGLNAIHRAVQALGGELRVSWED
jgi:hypothetical protein